MPTDEERALIPLQKARRALAEAKTVPEVKAIKDHGHAAIHWAKQQRDIGVEARNDAAEIVLEAERRLGEMLATMALHGGDRKSKSHDATLNLSTFGFSRSQSSRFQTAARVPLHTFRDWVTKIRAAGKELTSAALVRLGTQHRQVKKRRKPALPDAAGVVDDLGQLIEAGKTFGCIYADPPWAYDNQATRAATSDHYQTMSVEEICAEPVAELAAENCHLHLWTTNAFLFEAKRIIEAWGFEYKSVLVWVKTQMGIGNYWRVSHEFLLLGVKGQAPFLDRKQMSWFEAKRTKHSRKPRLAREKIEKVSPGPYLELYGREQIKGWTVYGNEVERMLC